MIEEVQIPEISENVESGTVVSVLVQVGDMVDIDDVLVEFETEKALVDIPSTAKGRIVDLFAKEGDEMRVGDVIARVDTEAESAFTDTPESVPVATPTAGTVAAAPREDAAERQDAEPPREITAAEPEELPVKPVTRAAPGKAAPEIADRPPEAGPIPASPSVRRFARELGVNINEVAASGPGGRITEADVKAHIKGKEQPGRVAAYGAGPAIKVEEAALPDFGRWGDIEVQDLDAVRRITAANMSTAWHMVPQVTQFDQADVTALQEFINKNAEQVSRSGGKLTVTAILAKVCAAALKRFERFNASIDTASQQLILKKYVHMGIAVDTPRGLLVPVVRNADEKGISQLAAEITDLAERARSKKLKPDEMEGGTFTISNQGGIGGVGFTPIVFWPQVAILGVSRASIAPRYIGGEFKPRSMLPLSLSFDHRLIDGADAARFLRWMCDSLEQPFALLL